MPYRNISATYIPFDPELFTEICVQISCGEYLNAVCKRMGIKQHNFFFWLSHDKRLTKAQRDEIRTIYYQAVEDRVLQYVEEVVGEADKATGKDNAMAAKVRSDARKWILSRLLAHKYGDKVKLEGGDQNGLFVVRWKNESEDKPKDTGGK